MLQIRLRERLREDLGGTYSVSVSSALAREPDEEYSFTIRFGSAPDRVDELLGVIYEQIDSIKTVGPTEDNVAKVREA